MTYLPQFAINTMVDNDDGVYRINKPGVVHPDSGDRGATDRRQSHQQPDAAAS